MDGTIIGSVVSGVFEIIGFIIWLDSKHEKALDKMEKALDKMDERWMWLFERTDHKLDHLTQKK